MQFSHLSIMNIYENLRNLEKTQEKWGIQLSYLLH